MPLPKVSNAIIETFLETHMTSEDIGKQIQDFHERLEREGNKELGKALTEFVFSIFDEEGCGDYVNQTLKEVLERINRGEMEEKDLYGFAPQEDYGFYGIAPSKEYDPSKEISEDLEESLDYAMEASNWFLLGAHFVYGVLSRAAEIEEMEKQFS